MIDVDATITDHNNLANRGFIRTEHDVHFRVDGVTQSSEVRMEIAQGNCMYKFFVMQHPEEAPGVDETSGLANDVADHIDELDDAAVAAELCPYRPPRNVGSGAVSVSEAVTIGVFHRPGVVSVDNDPQRTPHGVVREVSFEYDIDMVIENSVTGEPCIYNIDA